MDSFSRIPRSMEVHFALEIPKHVAFFCTKWYNNNDSETLVINYSIVAERGFPGFRTVTGIRNNIPSSHFPENWK